LLRIDCFVEGNKKDFCRHDEEEKGKKEEVLENFEGFLFAKNDEAILSFLQLFVRLIH
jgi:hypothetical protein